MFLGTGLGFFIVLHPRRTEEKTSIDDRIKIDKWIPL